MVLLLEDQEIPIVLMKVIISAHRTGTYVCKDHGTTEQNIYPDNGSVILLADYNPRVPRLR